MIEISKNEANREDIEVVAQLEDSVAGILNNNRECLKNYQIVKIFKYN